MDEQTVQLLAQMMSSAKKGNKNLSSLMGNIDNSILLAMAGALDPYYGQQQSTGSLYSQYAGDPTTPAAVKAVMDYVDQGMNKYQIEKQINALDLDVVNDSGYTQKQLIAMGAEMANERTKSGSSDVFSKAGFRNPNDIYSVGDVPMDTGRTARFKKYMSEADVAGKPIGSLESALRKSQKKLFDANTQNAKERAKQWVDENISRVGGIDAGGVSMNLAPKMKAEIDKMSDEEVRKEYNLPKAATMADYDAATRNVAALADQRTKETLARRKALAVREGALSQAAASGRTPFTDQVQTLLKFISGTK